MPTSTCRHPTYLLYLLLGVIFLLLSLAGRAGELQLQGDYTQGGLIIGRTQPGVRITLDGQSVRVSPRGEFVFGFDRDASTTARLEVVFPDGRRQTQLLTVKPRRYDIQRISGLPADKVTPPPAVWERIQREKAQLAAAYRQDLDTPYFLNGFRWPAQGRISGVYGSQRILNGEPRQPHYGVDIAAPPGTPVKAPADGVVTFANPAMYFSGGTLVVDHGHGLSSSFLHLQAIYVSVGQKVKQGDVIAAVGATGRVSGPHLDWRVNWFTRHIDPALLAPPM